MDHSPASFFKSLVAATVRLLPLTLPYLYFLPHIRLVCSSRSISKGGFKLIWKDGLNPFSPWISWWAKV